MRNRLLLIAVWLVLGGLMAFFMRGFVREAIVDPIVYFVWVTRLYVESVHQAIPWVAFLVIGFAIALRGVLGSNPFTLRGRDVAREQPGRLQILARWIRMAGQGRYFKWRLAHHLGTLSLDALSQSGRLSRAEVRYQLESGRLDVPPEITAFLLAGLGKESQDRHTGSALDLDVNRVVAFLEARIGEKVGSKN
jgi:hypothetical protein